MIVTRMLGGLGNQMFQYAAGRSLALSTGQDLGLDLTEMERYRLRAYALDQFRISATAIGRLGPRRGLAGVWRRLTGPRLVPITEGGVAFEPRVLGVTGPAYLSGYWQSEKYFSAHAEAIRADFALAQPLSPSGAALLADIRAAVAVSVHVRRGDYVSNPAANAVHGTCEPDWYAAAMARLEARHGAVTFFVFSDDPAWCRKTLRSARPMVFVEPSAERRDGEDIHLMAACRHHIIANSSFSWWGAWLNPAPDKTVIAPGQWFRDPSKDASDLVPARWERL